MKAIYKILRAASKPILGRGWGGLLSYLALCTMIASCVNDLPYDAKIGSPKLVLNALLQPDSVLTATVSRTVHFLDAEDPQRLSDATVTAVINGASHDLVYEDSTQSYHSTYTLCAGDEVTLTAHTTYGEATATVKVASPIDISLTNITMQPFVNPGDPVSLATLNDVDSTMLVTLHIDDPADEANYYRLTINYYATYEAKYPAEWIYGSDFSDESISEEGYIISRDRFFPHYLLTESSSRLLIDNETATQLVGSLLYMTGSNSFLFSDEQLLNKDKQPLIDLSLLLESPRKGEDMYNPESGLGYDDELDYSVFIFPSDTISQAFYHYEFALETLSEDYYRYLSTVSTYEGIGNMVSEPVRIHSNVSSGVGIVGTSGCAAIEDSVRVIF